MPDHLSDVKSRLIDRVLSPAAPAALYDPFAMIALHAAVSNQLWWICGPYSKQVLVDAEAASRPAAASASD